MAVVGMELVDVVGTEVGFSVVDEVLLEIVAVLVVMSPGVLVVVDVAAGVLLMSDVATADLLMVSDGLDGGR